MRPVWGQKRGGTDVTARLSRFPRTGSRGDTATKRGRRAGESKNLITIDVKERG
jgi:hypothetical protein